MESNESAAIHRPARKKIANDTNLGVRNVRLDVCVDQGETAAICILKLVSDKPRLT